MENNPLVSILIPNYNRADLIGETLKSIQSQSYQSWECIIVDDGSTDKSFEVINEFEKNDARIRLIKRNREPKGAPVCRNIGIENARGEFVVFLDSDDLLEYSNLARRVSIFNQNPDYDFIVFNSRMFNFSPYDSDNLWNTDNEDDSDLLRFLRVDALWCISGPIYKKEFLIKIGGFCENLGFWQDFELHVRAILSKGKYLKFLHLPADVHIRNSNVESISRSIPFVENKSILSQRINVYFSFFNMVLSSEERKNPEVFHTMYSMLFFLVSQYFLKHNDFVLFFRQWKEVRLGLNLSQIQFYNSIGFCLLLKSCNKFRRLKQYTRALEKIAFLQLPNFYIMANNTLYKIRTTQKVVN